MGSGEGGGAGGAVERRRSIGGGEGGGGGKAGAKKNRAGRRRPMVQERYRGAPKEDADVVKRVFRVSGRGTGQRCYPPLPSRLIRLHTQ